MLASRVANDRADTAPITAADYIRLRRAAAGLSQRDVASRLFAIQIRRPHRDRRPRRLFASLDQALATIQQLEVPGARAKYRPIIDVLGGVFPLDPDVYHQLADEPTDRRPAICSGCGGSNGDAISLDLPFAIENGICLQCRTSRSLAA